jgi:glyoxalase family protein
VESRADTRAPWRKADIDDASAVRGIHGVTLTVRDPTQTLGFMNELMETSVVGEGEGAMRVAVNGDAPGRLVEIVRADEAPAAVNGLGTVHHVAFAVDDPEQQLEIRRDCCGVACR